MEWQDVCEAPHLQDLPYKIELNRWGKIEMSPAKNIQGIYQSELVRALYQQFSSGKVITECGVQTKDHVKVADVAWISSERYTQVAHEIAYSQAPEICIEVVSPSNTHQEMAWKMGLYFAAGAQECWLCNEQGELSFFSPQGQMESSQRAPQFPQKIQL